MFFKSFAAGGAIPHHSLGVAGTFSLEASAARLLLERLLLANKHNQPLEIGEQKLERARPRLVVAQLRLDADRRIAADL
jgi:hypothetical protein